MSEDFLIFTIDEFKINLLIHNKPDDKNDKNDKNILKKYLEQFYIQAHEASRLGLCTFIINFEHNLDSNIKANILTELVKIYKNQYILKKETKDYVIFQAIL